MTAADQFAGNATDSVSPTPVQVTSVGVAPGVRRTRTVPLSSQSVPSAAYVPDGTTTPSYVSARMVDVASAGTAMRPFGPSATVTCEKS